MFKPVWRWNWELGQWQPRDVLRYRQWTAADDFRYHRLRIDSFAKLVTFG